MYRLNKSKTIKLYIVANKKFVKVYNS